MKKYVLILALTLYAVPTEAGEALITRVRGSVLTIDAGAEAGIIKGLSVDIVRPPGEAVIHPITGENLGAPELVIGRGEISKTSNRAANVQVEPGLLLSVRPGDIARFTTPDEEMLMDQERSVATQERNQEEHQGFRNDISRLTRSIKSVQGRIGGLENMMKRVERVEEGFRVQLRGINSDMNVMKEDISDLKEAVSLMGAVPIAGLDQEEELQESVDLSSEESVGQIRQIVQDVLDEAQVGMAPVGREELELPDETSLDMNSDEDESEEGTGEEPFYTQTWFFLLFGVIGILLIAAYFYMRLTRGSDEDEEMEEEVDHDDDDEIDLDDLDLDEEDDIVVEETS